MKTTKLLFLVIALIIAQFATRAYAVVNPVNVTVDGTTLGGSPFLTLGAAMTAIGTSRTGVIDVAISANTNEGATSAIIGAGIWTSLTIHPSVANLAVTGNNGSSATIKLSGAQHVIIDGSIDGTGSDKNLTILNTSGSGGVITFIVGASNNIIRNCIIKGGNASNLYGIIYMTAGSGTGNDNNTITNNDITVNSTISRPPIAININGASASIKDDGNKILNNNIYNVCPATVAVGTNVVAAVFIGVNTSATEISGNSIYETTASPTIAPNNVALTVYGICVGGAGTTVDVNKVSNNYVGGTGPLCVGSYVLSAGGTLSTSYNGIYFSVAGTSATANTVTGNTVKNVSLLGTNNLAQNMYGIRATAPNLTIDGNTIQNLTSTSTNTASVVQGIQSSSSTSQAVSNNTISALSTNAPNASTTDLTLSVIGIYQGGTGSASISGNNITNLFNTSNSTTALIALSGIVLSGSNNNAAQVSVSSNFISSISSPNISGVGSQIYGIKTGYNVTMSSTIVNNVILLGDASISQIMGIYDRAYNVASTINCYHNTVNIVGTAATTGTTQNSYAYYQNNNGTGKDLRNNILVNVRTSTSGAINYPIGISATTLASSTVDYNDYYGGTAWATSIATGGDTHSVTVDPTFPASLATNMLINNVVAADLKASNNALVGVSGTGITVDYLGVSRNTPPRMGAFEGTFVVTDALKSIRPTNLVYSINSNIVIEGLAGQTAMIYSISGQLVKSVLLTTDRESIAANNGVYIVKVGVQNFKLLVK